MYRNNLVNIEKTKPLQMIKLCHRVTIGTCKLTKRVQYNITGTNMSERYRFGFHDSYEFRHVLCSEVLKRNGFESQECDNSLQTKGSKNRFCGSLPTFQPECTCKKSRVASQRRSFEAAVSSLEERTRKYGT